MLAILGSAQTFRVSGSNLQIVGGSGNLSYSLSPLNRPEEVAPPNAVIVAPSQARVNQTVTFDGSRSTSGAPLIQWRWDFGDGGRGSGPVVQHVYRNPGDYRVQMSVNDQLGRMSSTVWTIQDLGAANTDASANCRSDRCSDYSPAAHCCANQVAAAHCRTDRRADRCAAANRGSDRSAAANRGSAADG